MNCCNEFGQCTQGADCPVRANSVPPFQCCPIRKKSPQQELASDIFYFIGFALILAAICLIAGITWGLLERFYPSTACMILQLFSTNCK